MRDHFSLSKEAYESLIKNKVTVTDLFRSIKLFDPYDTGAPINFVGLMYYVDKMGDFEQPPLFVHKKIAKAFWEGLPIKQKIAIAEYIEDSENDFEDYES
jgi:hypothetical protein